MPPWAPQNKKPGKNETLGDSGSCDADRGRRPSLAGGMPAWAQSREGAAANSCEGSRRPSLSGGMPAWAPAPSTEQGTSTDTLDASAGRSAESAVAAAAPALPDWIVAATRASCGDVRKCCLESELDIQYSGGEVGILRQDSGSCLVVALSARGGGTSCVPILQRCIHT